eukprot:4375657-Karenia_brevis.AAC.1
MAAEETGLQIHMGKTKCLSNLETNEGGHVEVAGNRIEILPFSASAEYLGRLLSLDSLHDTEIAS